MKLFLDTGNIEDIRIAAETGLVDGVTTNPSLIAKEGKPFVPTLKKIAKIVQKHNKRAVINGEVVSTDFSGMMKEALRLVRLTPNMIIKIPLIPDGLKAVYALHKKKIGTNVTLCFTAAQALLAAKAGATYISPFIGRLDDITSEGMEVVGEIRQIYDNYGYPTEILVASVRSPRQITDAALVGADICTLPTKIYHQLFKHPLPDTGLQKFLADWEAYQKKQK